MIWCFCKDSDDCNVSIEQMNKTKTLTAEDFGDYYEDFYEDETTTLPTTTTEMPKEEEKEEPGTVQ